MNHCRFCEYWHKHNDGTGASGQCRGLVIVDNCLLLYAGDELEPDEQYAETVANFGCQFFKHKK